MRKIRQILVVLILVLSGTSNLYLNAQVKVQVVSQKISKEIAYFPGMAVMISGEHAEIYCSSYTGNQILIDLTIISKHENRNTAETDLKKMKWLNEVKGNVCFIRNYIELEKDDATPESLLKVIYTIRIPQNCALNIKNSFGKTELDSISSGIIIKSEFSPLIINNIDGVLDINALFSDISATTILGTTNITSNRSDVRLQDIGGQITLFASSGHIFLQEFKTLKSCRIEASNIILDAELAGPEDYSLLLDLKTSNLAIPQSFILTYLEKKKDHTRASWNAGKPLPLLDIKLENSTFNINQSGF